MPVLSDLQRSFTEFLLSAPGTHADPVLCEAIREQDASTATRLAVYKNNVYSQLIGALGDRYPAVRRLTGAEFFRFAATEYIQAHPPRMPTLARYGENFAGFLETFEPASSVPYLPDVARLEQLYLESYHATEAVPLSKEAFARYLSDAAVRPTPRLHPSARLMKSPFSVSHIWEVNRRPTAVDGGRRMSGGGEHLLIVRPHATVEVRRIARGAYAALTALTQGSTVAEALAAGSNAEPRLDLVTHLSSLAAGETFAHEESQ